MKDEKTTPGSKQRERGGERGREPKALLTDDGVHAKEEGDGSEGVLVEGQEELVLVEKAGEDERGDGRDPRAHLGFAQRDVDAALQGSRDWRGGARAVERRGRRSETR